MNRRGEIGHWGETQACSFLLRHGFFVLDRNYHSTFGEIDIVAQKNQDYYFVEVKTRQQGAMAWNDAVTPEKLRRFKKTAKIYSSRNNIPDVGQIIAILMVVYNTENNIIKFSLTALI